MIFEELSRRYIVKCCNPFVFIWFKLRVAHNCVSRHTLTPTPYNYATHRVVNNRKLMKLFVYSI